MKKINLIFWLSTLCINLVMAQGNFAVNTINPELLKDANAVIREDYSTFEILNNDEAIYRVRLVVTILNSNAKYQAQKVLGYSKNIKINNFKGATFDANGKQIKRLKQTEIYDQSAYEGQGSYSDNRLKAADLTHGSYPYTVEWEYELKYNYLFIIPEFVIAGDYYTSAEISKCDFIYPAELKPRFKTYNFSEPLLNSSRDGKQVTTFEFKNFKAIKPEEYSPNPQYIFPHISAAPEKFKFDKYEGEMHSWDSFGQWIAQLNAGKQELPIKTIEEVKQIAAKYSTNEEKIKAIYEYMQSKTRYVSIQFGIGGFQPIDAFSVDQAGYGDCKALSNYMVAMLKEVGIEANYVLIEAGKNAGDLDETFPSSQFNHAVVAVPNAKDTLWLECTSQTNPFGYMGSFTGNRKALAITDEGAKIVYTPKYTENENLQNRIAEVKLDANGNAIAQVKTIYQAQQYENDNLNFILNDQFDLQKKWIQENTGIPSFNLVNFHVKEIKDKIPSAHVDLKLELNKLANVSGKRMFITPNLMNRFSQAPAPSENRTLPVNRRIGYTDIDTIRFQFPEAFYPEFIPKPTKIESEFGVYENSYLMDEGSLVYVRKLVMKKGVFPASSYNNLVNFYKSIIKADNTKLVLLTKT